MREILRLSLRRLARFLLALAVVGLAGRPIHAGPIETGVGVGMSYYDHRSAIAGPSNFSARTVTPLLLVHVDRPLTALDLSAQRRFEFYSGQSVDSLVGTGDHTADRANLRFRQRWSELDEAGITGDYVRSRDLLDFDSGTVQAAGDLTRWELGGGGAVWHAEGSYRMRARDYDNPGSSDSRSLDWLARGVPLKLPTQSLYGGWHQQQFEV